MNSLEERIQAVLEDRTDSSWDDLIRLYRKDAEAFYLLACDGAGPPIEDLGALAQQIRSAIRESYEIDLTGSGASFVTASGTSVPIPENQLPAVKRFLREIDGQGQSESAGKDYVGTEASEAEARFKFGDASFWEADRDKIQARLISKPHVFRLSEEEIEHLKSQPAYVTHGLLNCARKTILAPTAVFQGLRRGVGACEDVQDGWAFCGKPRQAFDNDGSASLAPIGMVYVVFADREGFVFDWDWVKENPGEPGCPIDRDLRFGNPIEWKRDGVLQLPTDLKPGNFDASRACYSDRGDCIFCYISDEVAFAERINPDLTVFRQLGGDKITGFKVKNLSRIMREDKSIILDDVPDLTVSVRRALLATLKGQRETEVRVYEVIIEAWPTTVKSPTVRVPKSRGPESEFQRVR